MTENKCLHTVASCWTFINIVSWCTEPCVKKKSLKFLNYVQKHGGTLLRYPAEARNLHFISVRISFGTHQASCIVGTSAVSPGAKRSGREADCCPPSYSEVMNKLSCISSLPICLLGLHRDNLPFLVKNMIEDKSNWEQNVSFCILCKDIHFVWHFFVICVSWRW